MSHTQSLPHMIIRRLPLILAGFVASVVLAGSGYAQQVVYYSPRSSTANSIRESIHPFPAHIRLLQRIRSGCSCSDQFGSGDGATMLRQQRLTTLRLRLLRTMLQQRHITHQKPHITHRQRPTTHQPHTLHHIITAGASSAAIVLHVEWSIQPTNR